MSAGSWLRALSQWTNPPSHRHTLRSRPGKKPCVEELETRVLLASSLTISDGSLIEGDSGSADMMFTVRRTGDLSAALVVSYATTDFTAQSGADYVAQTGVVTLVAGASSATIAVPVLGDELDEPDEQFQIFLSSVNFLPAPLTFSTRQDFAIGSSQSSIDMLSADFNLDGRPDFAAANRTTDSAGVLLNTTAPGAATPSFATAVQVPTSDNPNRIAVGDINGDGRPDLATANYSSGGSLSVLLNTTTPGSSTASFTSENFATRSNPYGVAIGDLNGDGRPEVIVAHNFGMAVSVFPNTTAPGAAAATFAPRQDFLQSSVRMSAAQVADLNLDGRLDVVVAWSDLSGTHASVLVNTTPAGSAVISFATRQDFLTPGGVHNISVGDLNGDGRPDLGVAGLNTNAAALLVNTTSPGAVTVSFSIQSQVVAGNSATSASFSDMNLDGKLDLLMPQFVTGTGFQTVLLLNTTVPGAQALTFLPPQASTIGLAGPRDYLGVDVNLDGRPDLAYANLGPGLLSVQLATTTLGDAGGLNLPRTAVPVLNAPVAVTEVDLNGDGLPDLAVANRDSDRVSVLMNATPSGLPRPAFAPLRSFFTGSEAHGVSAADFNLDGKPDLAVANRNSGTVTILTNTTTTGSDVAAFAFQMNLPGGVRPRGTAVADVNRDGRPDLLVTHEALTSQLSVYLNSTAPGAVTPSFDARQIFAVGANPLTVAVGDINGDGLPDAVTANYDASTVSVLLNTTVPGTATVGFSRQDFQTNTNPFSAAVGDVNGDGRPDVVVADYGAQTMSVLLNTTPLGDPTPSLLLRQTFDTGARSRGVVIGDLNRDGRADVIISKSNTDLAVFLNLGPPGATLLSFAPRQDFAAATGATHLALVDLNGDGRPDLASADRNSNTLSVFLNMPAAVTDGQGFGFIRDDDVPTLQVTAFTPTPSGFEVRFNRPFDPTVLNLYDTETGGLGAPDATLLRNGTDPVIGSLLLHQDNTGVTFIQTGGVLPAGGYAVTLRSTTNGFKDTSGDPLDGNGDGTTGDSYTDSFVVAGPTSRIVQVPDFTRGAGQPVNIPPTGIIGGLPLRISDGSGVTTIELTLTWDPRLLTVNGATRGPSIPAGAELITTINPGRMTLRLNSPVSLNPGLVDFVTLAAVVPDDAPYASKHLLDLSAVQLNAGGLDVTADDGIHVAAYFGDASGNRSYSAIDGQRTLRVVLGLDRGFAAYRLADPVLIADITGNGGLTSFDALRIMREAIGIDQLEIPDLPPGVVPLPATGPDPLLNMPTSLTGRRGDVVTVPLNLDLSDGLQTADIAISYDTSRLEVLSDADIDRGSLTGDFDLFLANLDAQAGTIRVGMGRTAGGLAGRGSGSVLAITFRIKSDAPPGAAAINLLNDLALTRTLLNEGELVLNPTPSNDAGDVLDGRIAVQVNDSPLSQVQDVVVNDGTAPRSLVSSLTVTFSTVVRFLGKPVSAFRLSGPRGVVGLKAVVGLDVTGTKTVVRLTFRGKGVSNGSLLDGSYMLMIDGDRILDGQGRAVDGDGNGSAGGDATEAFFRLYGDGDGDGDVDAMDQAAFDAAFGKRARDLAYVAYFDFNGNRRIDSKDRAQLLRRLGGTI